LGENTLNKQIFLGLFFTIFFLASVAFSQTVRPPLSDNQSWNDLQITVPITKKLNGIFSGTLRIGRNFRRPVDERVGFQLSYKANKNFTFASGVLYRAAQPFANRKTYETRFIGSVTATLPIGKYSLSNRNQYEYRFQNSRANNWNYRNRTQLEREITIGKTKVKPFIYAEFFYDGARKDWFRGRYAAGVSKKFNKNFTLDVYYMRQQDGISRPGNLNVIGTTWKVHL
jgi:Protein of unknown function (DUF2490)